MPCAYLFLYVFSLSIPIFYHSAFFVGFITIVELIVKRKISTVLRITKYQFKYLILFIFGFLLVCAIVIIHDTYDLSFLKTFTNSFLSALCAIPLARIYQLHYCDKSVDILLTHITVIFFLQSLIILTVLFIPGLKPLVIFFHRSSDYAEEIDAFSGGLRSNALSGGLFFGLSLSFSLALLCQIYKQVARSVINPVSSTLSFVIINIGLVCTGRFGFIYLLSSIFIFWSSNLYRRIKMGLFFFTIFFITIVGSLFLYNTIDSVKVIIDDKIIPYFFESLLIFIETGVMETASTNELVNMYSINADVETWLFGDGLYMGGDGLYYKHTDVGYIRILLLGGVPLLIYILAFFLYSIRPTKYLDKKGIYFYFAILSLFALAEFKGEAMIISVSINNMVFLLGSVISLSAKMPSAK